MTGEHKMEEGNNVSRLFISGGNMLAVIILQIIRIETRILLPKVIYYYRLLVTTLIENNNKH